MAANNSIGTQYQINFINNSSNAGSFMVFQQHPDMNLPDSVPLAWFTKYVHPNTQGLFSWKTGFDFAWLEQKSLAADITSVTFQCIPTNLETNNVALLTYDGGYNFVIQPDSGIAGSLYIRTDNTIGPYEVKVGVGMSGAPVFLVPSMPNMDMTFTPNPQYWIAFGEYEKGQVVNAKEITNLLQVEFPEGITTVNVVLNPDNTWTAHWG